MFSYDVSSTQLLISFILLLIISTFTALYADKMGRNPLAWFILALLFSFFAPLVLLLLPSLKKEEEKNITSIKENSLSPSQPPKPQDNLYNQENQILLEDTLWYYLDDNRKQFGPLSIIGLKELWNRGQLTMKNYVWTEGMKEWEKVENIKGLHEKLIEAKELL